MPSAAETAAAFLEAQGVRKPLATGIIAGTGLGSLTESVAESIVLPYATIPGFGSVQVSGHAGRLVVGSLENAPVALLDGRIHYYEEGNPAAMKLALQTLALMGVQRIIVTNSAGSVREDWPPGTIALLHDHINMSGTNPLIGEKTDRRFVPMTEAYDPGLRQRMHEVAANEGIALREGTYMWFSGPSFETPAEIRMARLLGADLVGMSTVPEVIMARWLGLEVLALSVVTNFGAGIGGATPSHSETQEVARSGAITLRRLVRAFLRSSGP